MPVTSDTARAISILASLLWAAGVAGARQYRLELGLDHRLDELAHPIAHADFDRIKPVVEKMDRRLGFRLQGCRVRAIAGHGVVSTGDGGYASLDNLKQAKALGVEDVAFHKKRALTIDAMVKSRWVYSKMKNYRDGIEDKIY